MNFSALLTNIFAYIRGLFLLRIWKIEENLYQSGAFYWWTRHAIMGKNIKGIVDLEGLPDVNVSGVEWNIHWPIVDGPLPDLVKLHSIADIVVKHIKFHGVLVHCGAGANRSGLLNAVVLYKLGYRGKEILNKIRSARPNALNNPIFEKYVLEELK